MSRYKRRLERDLDRWVADGLVPAASKSLILERVTDQPRFDAATALAIIGVVFLGAAIIAFTAANWDGIPRIVRFLLLLSAFAAAAGGAAYALHSKRILTSDALLTLAAAIFAASIGLTGQVFDIAGDPRAALIGAAVGATALGLAGRSIGAVTAGIVFAGLSDVTDTFGAGLDAIPPTVLLFAAIGAVCAVRWRSAVLYHVVSIGGLAGLLLWILRAEPSAAWFMVLAMIAGIVAAAARAGKEGKDPNLSIVYGWMVWGALFFFMLGGFGWSGEAALPGLLHRIIWLGAGAGVIALGRHDGHALVTAGGVLAVFGAMAALLMDLGLDLISASLVFGVGSLIALGVGLWLRRRARAST
ncbi:DUF2157 domain-containing protein [bacterium]|nr:DUF2157 domain-containing protein [bacterium]